MICFFLIDCRYNQSTPSKTLQKAYIFQARRDFLEYICMFGSQHENGKNWSHLQITPSVVKKNISPFHRVYRQEILELHVLLLQEIMLPAI